MQPDFAHDLGIDGKGEVLDAAGAGGVEQEPRDVGPGIMPRGVGGVLGHADHAEIDIGIENAFLIGGKFFGERTSVRPVDHRMAAAGMQERMFLGGVAELVDHGLRDHGTWAKEETGAFDGVNLARGVVDFPAQRMRERVVQREARPGADMYLFVLDRKSVV